MRAPENVVAKKSRSAVPEVSSTVRELLLSQGAHESHDGLSLASGHQSIDAPLCVGLSGFGASWYAGEFWQPDYAGPAPSRQAEETLAAFLGERLLHAVAYAGNDVVSLGLVSGTEWTRWHLNFDRIELRSWRGTYDADIVLDQKALDWEPLPVS